MLASDIVKDDLKLLIPNLSFTHDICGGSFGTRDWIQGFTYTRQAILGKHSTKVATFPVVNKVYNFISCGPKLLTISTVKEVESIKHILREREREKLERRPGLNQSVLYGIQVVKTLKVELQFSSSTSSCEQLVRESWQQSFLGDQSLLQHARHHKVNAIILPDHREGTNLAS